MCVCGCLCLSVYVYVCLCIRRYLWLLCLSWLHPIYGRSFAIWPLLSIQWSSTELQILQWQAAISSGTTANTLNCQMRLIPKNAFLPSVPLSQSDRHSGKKIGNASEKLIKGKELLCNHSLHSWGSEASRVKLLGMRKSFGPRVKIGNSDI